MNYFIVMQMTNIQIQMHPYQNHPNFTKKKWSKNVERESILNIFSDKMKRRADDPRKVQVK